MNKYGPNNRSKAVEIIIVSLHVEMKPEYFSTQHLRNFLFFSLLFSLLIFNLTDYSAQAITNKKTKNNENNSNKTTKLFIHGSPCKSITCNHNQRKNILDQSL